MSQETGTGERKNGNNNEKYWERERFGEERAKGGCTGDTEADNRVVHTPLKPSVIAARVAGENYAPAGVGQCLAKPVEELSDVDVGDSTRECVAERNDTDEERPRDKRVQFAAIAALGVGPAGDQDLESGFGKELNSSCDANRGDTSTRNAFNQEDSKDWLYKAKARENKEVGEDEGAENFVHTYVRNTKATKDVKVIVIPTGAKRRNFCSYNKLKIPRLRPLRAYARNDSFSP